MYPEIIRYESTENKNPYIAIYSEANQSYRCYHEPFVWGNSPVYTLSMEQIREEIFEDPYWSVVSISQEKRISI